MNKQSYENDLNKDVLKYLPVKILPAISGLLTIYLLTRTLSSSLYSNYAFITATILLFGQLVSGWINSSVIFFYPDYESQNALDFLKINLIALQLILFLFGAICFALTCYFGLKDLLMIFYGLLLLLSQTFLNLLYSFLQAERRILVQIKSTSIQSLIQIVGILFCYFYNKENLYFVIAVIFLSYFIASNYVMYCDKIYSLIFNRKAGYFLDFGLAKRVLLYGLPICVWFFASQFYAIGDRILFKFFNIQDLVGNYASFRDLSVGLSGFITMPLLMASHPIIVKMWKNNESKNDIESVLNKNIKLLITLFTTVFIGVFLIGDWTLTHILEDKYLFDTNLMFLVLLSIFFGTVSMYLHKGLETSGKTVLMAKIALFVAGLSLLLNVLLLPTYGVKAACAISVVAQVSYCVISYWFSKCIFKIKISYVFLFKNILLIMIAFILFNFVFQKELFFLPRIIILFFCILYLFISSEELKAMIKIIKN